MITKFIMERAIEREKRLAAEKKLREKIALALLEQCKREGLAVTEVLKTIEELFTVNQKREFDEFVDDFLSHP